MTPHRRRSIDFKRIREAALASSESIVTRWLPNGRREGREWVAKNPRRADNSLGSFKINLRTGFWSDFKTGDRGGDLISLAAFLYDMKQDEAARNIADMLGIDAYE